MIYIGTTAYNAAETLTRTIESVLNQTYGEFKYYLCENGSIDNGATRKIVEEYAKTDKRIIPFYNEKNHVWDKNMEVISLPHDIEPDDFYCILDADDAYELNFFEEMLSFINKYDLDIAACGSEFIRTSDNKLSGYRILPQNLILHGNDFQDYFPVYYQFMRTIWGKIFKGKTLVNTIIDIKSPEIPRVYGNDTFFTMRAFRDAERVGVLAKSLHKYYLSGASTSYKFYPDRIKCDIILHEAALDFLKPYGPLSPQNEEFLYQVYGNAIWDTLNVIFNAHIPVPEKMQWIKEVFSCKHTKAMLRCSLNNDNMLCIKLKRSTLEWLLKQKECRNPKGANIAVEIITLLYEELPKQVSADCLEHLISKMPETIEYLLKKDYIKVMEKLQIWYKRHDKDNVPLTKLELVLRTYLNNPDDEFFSFLIDVKKKRPVCSRELHIDGKIEKILSKYPLFKDMSIDLVIAFPSAVRWAINGNYKQALEAFSTITNVEINDADAEAYILFGQNLSAAAENINAYIYFKKLWISYLLDCLRTKEASEELDEFGTILPEDEDFLELRKRLSLTVIEAQQSESEEAYS